MKLHGILSPLAAAALLSAGAAAAQTPAAQAPAAASAEEKLAAEVKKLREELEQLKGRADEAEVRAKDAVVLGDIPGSFRIPGSDLSLRLYGFVELDWVHDFRGDNSDSDYSTFGAYLPLKGTPEYSRTHRDYKTVRASRLGLETAYPTRWGVLQTKVEGDFNNEPRLGNAAVYVNGNGGGRAVITQQQTNSYGFRVRHAYGQFAGLLIGQTWSTFMDVDNSPETLDYNGPFGATFIRQPQIRYTYATPDYGSFTAALENSSSYVYNDLAYVIPGSLSRMPDLVVRWDKGFSWGSVSLRAVTQELRVDGLIDEPANIDTSIDPSATPRSGKASRRGWGAGATAFVKTRDNNDFLSLALTYGDGIGRYMNYIEGAFFDAARSKIVVERAVGVVAGYQYKPTPWVRINFVYGRVQELDNEYTEFAKATGNGGGFRFAINRYVQQAHVGPIFTPVKGVDLGVEAMWGERKTLAGEKGDMVRLNFMAKYYIN